MIGVMDNGIILYVGDRYCGYFAYATWRIAKRTQTRFGSLFDVLSDIVKYGGLAKNFVDTFREASESISRSVCFNIDVGNQYFPVPDGSRVKLREGRHGSTWGLYEACLSTSRMCDIFGDAYITGEHVIPIEFE